VGRDITFEKLHRDSDAVFIATGFSNSRSTGIEGIDGRGCYQALDLLADFAAGKDLPMGKEIVIIGGGNVAFDIARTLARLQRKHYGRVNITLACLEREGEMLADEEEIVQGQGEGLVIRTARSPKRVVFNDKGSVRGLDTVKCLSIFDEQNRFNPRVDESDREFYPADMMVEAIGQAPDYGFLGDQIQAKLDIVRGKIVTDEDGGTDLGHRSAQAIDAYLMKK